MTHVFQQTYLLRATKFLLKYEGKILNLLTPSYLQRLRSEKFAVKVSLNSFKHCTSASKNPGSQTKLSLSEETFGASNMPRQ